MSDYSYNENGSRRQWQIRYNYGKYSVVETTDIEPYQYAPNVSLGDGRFYNKADATIECLMLRITKQNDLSAQDDLDLFYERHPEYFL